MRVVVCVGLRPVCCVGALAAMPGHPLGPPAPANRPPDPSELPATPTWPPTPRTDPGLALGPILVVNQVRTDRQPVPNYLGLRPRWFGTCFDSFALCLRPKTAKTGPGSPRPEMWQLHVRLWCICSGPPALVRTAISAGSSRVLGRLRPGSGWQIYLFCFLGVI